MAGELLEHEIKVHFSHAWKRMGKALQRDLYGDQDVRQIEHYLTLPLLQMVSKERSLLKHGHILLIGWKGFLVSLQLFAELIHCKPWLN